ncbi:SCP-like extracellular protein [Campylobacter pinnipediorum subsp. pinnipediorum]|uniref:CAP domain-containing protein n=1 Tax=Campylobacter pinnipediorum TaxID=1965231 RepID=UPI0009955B14|nr:CAP domain-containing protein [Campylobacter pinnipediorum]AQW81343.1 SCP-like extracellular protein [Campylobacter pinnipediorum subsp. pinnipediorum]
MNSLKPALKYKFTIIFFLLILYIVSDILGFYSSNHNQLLVAKTPKEYNVFDGVDYINTIREDNGLGWFRANKNLEISATNHANHLLKNKDKISVSMHDEERNLDGFTGEDVSQRAMFAGYSSSYVVENISNNQINTRSSIDNLLSAIYHRFGFLNYSFNEIGFANVSFGDEKFYVYNMGNSYVNNICLKGGDFKNSGYYIDNVCKNNIYKIKQDSFKIATIPKSPEYIKFPYKNPALAYFSGEIPDPIPSCKIMGNPISIEFNPNIENIKMQSFKIFRDNKEIDDTVIITKQNDINHKFNKNQFALFSKKVFDFDKEYLAVFKYTQNNKDKEIRWSFKTLTPRFNYFSIKDGDILEIYPDRFYDIFIKPRDCNDVFTSYSYKKSTLLDAYVRDIGVNMIRISLSGYKGDKITISTNNGVKFKAILAKDSKNATKIFGFRLNYLVLVVLVFISFAFMIVDLKHQKNK